MSERKPDDKRVRRAAPEIAWTDLPKSGNDAPVPSLPWGWDMGEYGVAYWHRAWRSPESTQWSDSDQELVARLCQLHDLWMRSIEHGGKTFENEWNGKVTVLDVNMKVLPEMRHLETALGRTAKARKELRWRIVDAEPEQSGGAEPVKPRRLKIVG